MFTHKIASFVNSLFWFCQKQSGIKIKLMSFGIAHMLGPIGFILAAIASLVGFWAYLEKIVGL